MLTEATETEIGKVTVMDAGLILFGSVIEVAVKVTAEGAGGTVAGAVYVTGTPVRLELLLSDPQTETVQAFTPIVMTQFTPLFWASFETVAVSCAVRFTGMAGLEAEALTLTAGVTVMAAGAV